MIKFEVVALAHITEPLYSPAARISVIEPNIVGIEVFGPTGLRAVFDSRDDAEMFAADCNNTSNGPVFIVRPMRQ